MRQLLTLLIASLWLGSPASGQDDLIPELGVSYQRDIQPILRDACLGCHQPARSKGKLDLTSHASMLKGGRGGPAVIAEDPESSLLLEMVRPYEDEPPEMPIDAAPLSEAQCALIERWIREGARDDTDLTLGPRIGPENPPVYPRPPVITSIDHSPDGQWLAVSGYHEVLVWTSDGSELVARLIGLSERIESLAFSPDGFSLAVAGGVPGLSGELQIWGTEYWKLSNSIPVTHDTIFGLSWSPDGSLIAVGAADNSLRAFDAYSGEQVFFQGAHNDWVLDTTFSIDGSHLASASRDRTLKLSKVATQQFIDNITSITPGVLKGGLMAVERHPLRDELLVGGADGAPKIMRVYRELQRRIGDDHNLLKAFEPLDGRVFDVTWSPDGERIAAVSSVRQEQRSFGELNAYAVSDGKLLWKHVSPAGLYTLDFHPTAKRLAAAGAGGRIELIDTETGQVWKTFSPVPPSKAAADTPRTADAPPSSSTQTPVVVEAQGEDS